MQPDTARRSYKKISLNYVVFGLLQLVHSKILPVPKLFGIDAVNLGHKLTNEGLLIERRVVGAQEVVTGAEKAVVVNLEI